MQIDYISLGSRIKEARKKQGLTQEQLAERADLSTTHISNIENAKKSQACKPLLISQMLYLLPQIHFFVTILSSPKTSTAQKHSQSWMAVRSQKFVF